LTGDGKFLLPGRSPFTGRPRRVGRSDAVMHPMGRWQRFFNGFRSGKSPGDGIDPASLRLEFQSRYHRFKLLLSANNRALEIMTEIEKGLAGTTPFGMKFIRSRAMEAYTRVYQIVKHLHALAPGKYQALTPRLEEIRSALDALVEPIRETGAPGPFVIHLSGLDKTRADQAGLKMANLGEVANHLKVRVPDGFVVTARAFHHFLSHNDLKVEIQRRIQSAEEDGHHRLYTVSADIRQLIQASPLPPDLETAIGEAYRELAIRQQKEVHLAVRSSALNEDRPGASFAGLYHSALNVAGDHLADTYKQIVAAAYAPAVMAYRFSRGVPEEETEMCVGVIQMVDAVCGGVVYSADPLGVRDRSVVINSAWGLPRAVVDGTSATDLFHVAGDPELAVTLRRIAVKEKKYICYMDEGVCRMDDTGPDRTRASLTDRQAIDLAALALRMERYYGQPQDIEWAIDPSGRITLLQCRPLQIAAAASVPETGTATPEGLPGPVFQGGITASAGVAAGPVHRVLKEVDALDFPTGGVVVTDRALARWAALLPRAAAVVSEKGGVTGHLATVAREFGVPALFGATGVVDRLDGQEEVTVDAGHGRIYAGQVPSLLAADRRQASLPLMKETPVFAVLEKAAGLITPLTLLDPDSPSFRAANCRSLHDITRFCHEKSVHEMFRFGKTHRFPERSSKQLRAEIPMKWWVLNLDDGFTAGAVSERFVDIEHVASVPMLALWAGITAYPWEGPPPVDGRGFASVMFRATQNQALLPTVRTTMANRNYFMISRHYCSLQSRLGFHFAITEALVGERAAENYVSFQFKGGAADFNRRLKRVHLVKTVLDLHGFRTEVTGDALRARIEQYDAGVMCDKLKLLGYLTIHTRQLDMVMANPAQVARYRKKWTEQIGAMLGS
jgi:pyruvate, water dikinase